MEEEEKKKEEKFPLCESIGHRPLQGHCPKGRNGRMARRKECKEGRKEGGN